VERVRTLRVEAASGGYDVTLARTFRGLSAALSGCAGAVLVTEATVGPLWAAAVREALGPALRAEVVVAAGEANKTRAAWSTLCDALLESRVDRSTAVLALGGGVLGDLAGFAAATTLRGLPLVQLPTTLLAMVDSSVGGKVAVNHPAGKNLIGAFHPPIAVWMALDTLSTLPDAEIRCGWGEILKTALAADAALLEDLEGGLLARALADREVLAEVIERCVRAKARVVGSDEREAGLRMILNAGHTAGHAIEAALGPGTLRHGEAVAIGLVAELALAVQLGVCHDPTLPGRLSALIAGAGLPGAPDGPRVLALDDLDRQRFAAGIGVDKKAAGDKIRLPLAVRAGEMRIVDLALPDVISLFDLLPQPSRR
jgi:3-dehydroquinate synthase